MRNVHYCNQKNRIEHTQADLEKCFSCVAYISILFTHFGGLVLFLVFLCKMCDVTDNLQICPILLEYFGE